MYYNMGVCPDAQAGCDATGGVPPTCETYTVDIGAHWELATTEQGVTYPINTVETELVTTLSRTRTTSMPSVHTAALTMMATALETNGLEMVPLGWNRRRR
jgi:hypothetical protein